MRVTPEILEAAYELLRVTAPFNRWKLPNADDVEFRVWVTKRIAAEHCIRTDGGEHHCISVSAVKHSRLSGLLESVAHEMVHMRQHLQKDRDEHGESFQRYANRVCVLHGFDRATF